MKALHEEHNKTKSEFEEQMKVIIFSVTFVSQDRTLADPGDHRVDEHIFAHRSLQRYCGWMQAFQSHHAT